MAKLRVHWALRHQVLNSVFVPYESEDQILIWMEKQIAIFLGEWTGPNEIKNVDVDEELAFINLGNDRIRYFNLTQVKLYLTPALESKAFCVNNGNAVRRFGSQFGEYTDFST